MDATSPSIVASLRPADRSLTVVCDEEQFHRVAPLHLRFGPNLLRSRIPGIQPSDPVPFELSDSDCLLAAKLEHEIDHLHRHLATSYGLLLHMIHSRQIDLLFHYINTFGNGEEVRLPLTDNANGNGARDHAARLLSHYTTLVDLLTCVSARALLTPMEEREQAVESLFSDLFVPNEQRWPGRPTLEKTGTWAKPIVPSASSTVGLRPREWPLGAYGIIEYLGLSREVGLRREARIDYEETTRLIRVQAYQQIGQLWKDFFKCDLGHNATKTLPEELYLACDLALWIPCCPHGLVLSATKATLDWPDFHPGLRFLKILEYLARRGRLTPPRARLDATFEKSFVQLQDVICKEFNWARPVEISAAWIDYLEEAQGRNSHERRMMEDEWDRTEGALKLLKVRQKHPAIAAVGYWSARNFESLWFPACTVLNTRNRKSKLLCMSEPKAKLIELGYCLPPCLSLTSCLDLFARKRDERLMGEDLLSQYNREGRSLIRDFSRYAERHYGFPIAFGRAVANRHSTC